MPLIQSYATGNVGPGDEGQGTPFGPGKQPGGTTPTPPTDEEWQEAYDEFEQNLIEDQFEQQQEWQDYEDPQTGTDVEEQWVDPGMDEYSEWTATQANLSDFNVGRRYADILNAGGTLKDFYRDSKKVSNKKMKDFFQYTLKYPTFKEGLNMIRNHII